MKKEINPAGRVDVLLKRCLDLALKQYVECHPLAVRLKQGAGLDVAALARDEVRRRLERERITDVKSLQRALRK